MNVKAVVENEGCDISEYKLWWWRVLSMVLGVRFLVVKGELIFKVKIEDCDGGCCGCECVR